MLCAAAASSGSAAGVLTATAPVKATTTHVRPAIAGHVQAVSRTSPLPTSQCEAQIGIACYSPLQLRAAYDTAPLYAAGITGKGRTILIVDSFGSPTIQHDLEGFDKQWGILDTTVEVVKYGNVPPFDPTNPDHVGWAQETTLDVEYAHAIAPDAHIILAETPVAETEGVTGLPEMMNVEKQLIDQNRVDVVTQSFGATENTFPGVDHGDSSSIQNLRYAFADALLHGTTVLASSGDDGATDAQADGATLYDHPVISWPSSDPLVTSVGGTQLHLDDNGNRISPDVTWNDGYGAGGGGLSQVFSRPIYQLGVRNVVGNHRGTPDISMSAAVDGGAWVYYTFVNEASPWHIFGGTSEASPIFSGVVALADQAGGRRLGLLNGELYLDGALRPVLGARTGLVDVTSGDNSFADVTGYPAKTGYDLATGWGTVDVAKFVKAVAPNAHF
ncbi:MAG TPA: S53 family peptidase [Pedococcus sp.]|nr:S53 family peptidase [Pedococcus sp.]